MGRDAGGWMRLGSTQGQGGVGLEISATTGAIKGGRVPGSVGVDSTK